ncbi:amidase domain-containing protein [Streptomyces sp. NBC_00258]|uniref:amidase domain-containing protein n=1 Tax=Streptomyces sp. NBC_00258 TaxID=2903642 RepID=UPI002E2A5BD0|nr:amidase domain-containing protein [Streptomyces sp. NBC_00258]
MHPHARIRSVYCATILSLATIGLSAPHVEAAPAPAALSSDDTEGMMDITSGYLKERANVITTEGAEKAKKAAPAAPAKGKMTAALAAKTAREYAALALLRAQLNQDNGGYSRAEVSVTPVTTTVEGDAATMEVTEDARLYYPNVPAGDPEYEEYSVPHTLTFVRGSDGGWLLDSDKIDASLTGPGPVTQLGQPGSATPSDAESEGQLEAGGSTVPVTDVEDDKPLETDPAEGSVGTRAANAGYSYGKMVSYANKYWKNANSDYRKYGSDCTNFISQAMRSGGWNTTAGSFVTRKDNKKWFYGSFESTTSYTWAGAENWYWFAKKHSKRTRILSNVWQLLSADVLQADWKRDGIIDHTMIVTKRGSKGEIYLTYHTPSKHNVKLSTLLRKYPNAAWYAHRT